jgi:hypothetical protein
MPERMVDLDQLVTLGDACERLQVSPAFFRVARSRSSVPFPEPVAVIGGAEVYLLDELVAWRARK